MKILLVSISFPPKKDPECIQTARYFKYLSAIPSLDFEILTTSKTQNMPFDQSMKKYDKGYMSKTEIKLVENKFLNSIISRVYPSLFFPDFKSQFIRKSKKVCLAEKPDVIYSRSFPVSSAVASYFLHRRLEVPWIMHLSDPWSLTPLHSYSQGTLEKHKKMEVICIQSASAITFTSKKTVELYQKHYPEFSNRFHYFPNVFDESDYRITDFGWKKTIKIVHTGGLIGSRNPSYFFDAFKKLNPEERSHFEIIFAGDTDRNSKRILGEMTHQFPNEVKYLGLLSQENAQDLQRSADLLLAIDNPINDFKLSLFFPSKLLDYFLAQRKIIAITPRESTTSEILSSHYIFEHQNSDKLAQHLRNSIQNHRLKNVDFFYNSDIPEEYSARFQAEKLSKLISSYA
ncbi:hypothetical protein [Ekhidna sp.]|uniref:hypothetical protein n=1 Tax=Ekhidna sp. TaxID=2608089 RepID=UPI003B50C209